MVGGPVFFPESPVAGDVCALVFSTCVALSLLRIFEETAKRGVFDQKLNRKLVHITIGLAFMLCWPLFSSGSQGAVIAALVPGVNIIKVLLIGFGIVKDEATVKSMSRFGNYRELLTGPLYYASTITLCCIIYWRTSPISIAAICNLCAGDGFADIIGRQFGKKKLPYNTNKSFAGSIAMATSGFIASIGYMYYYSMFGFVEKSFGMMVGFLAVSVASALVESHPISTKFDDNLTVPLASVLLGTLGCFRNRLQSSTSSLVVLGEWTSFGAGGSIMNPSFNTVDSFLNWGRQVDLKAFNEMFFFSAAVSTFCWVIWRSRMNEAPRHYRGKKGFPLLIFGFSPTFYVKVYFV